MNISFISIGNWGWLMSSGEKTFLRGEPFQAERGSGEASSDKSSHGSVKVFSLAVGGSG
jgi:hypothetical protein